MDAYQTSLATAALYIVIIVGLVIGYLLYSAVRQHQRRVQAQRQYLFEASSQVEEERSRIGRDLHDEVGPLVWFALTVLEVESRKERPGAEAIEKAKKKLEKALEEMGRIALDLLPVRALEKGLCTALNDLFRDLQVAFPQQAFSFSCHLQTAVSPKRSLHLYRIVQEVVRNALKHAAAQRVEVVLNERAGWLYLLCRDDGSGFDTTAADVRRGVGIRNLRSRTELLGGNMRLLSEAGSGTTYFFSFPV